MQNLLRQNLYIQLLSRNLYMKHLFRNRFTRLRFRRLYTKLLCRNLYMKLLQQNLKEAIPYGQFQCYYESQGPEDAVVFTALNIDPADADTFKAIVDDTLKTLAETGFAQEQVDGGLALSLVDAEHTMGVTVQVVKVDLQSFVNDAMSKGGQGFKELKVNGMQSINFNMVNEEGLVTTCFAFSAGGGSATFLFSFAPANEQTAGLFRIMAGSIQPVQ